jgi:hypothetical protein
VRKRAEIESEARASYEHYPEEQILEVLLDIRALLLSSKQILEK